MSDFSTLSIKQLKQLLNAKCLQLPEDQATLIRTRVGSIVEKLDLVNLCKENVKQEEIEKLLATSTGSSSSSSTTTSTPTAAAAKPTNTAR
jgi:hypothetical protein